MTGYSVEIVACGSRAHLEDLDNLRSRGFAIPHEYSSWPLHSTIGTWVWCRAVDPAGGLATGFAIHLTSSRAIPWMRIGRVDRVGRALHEEAVDEVGALLHAATGQIPRLLRLDCRVFDEDPERRRRYEESLRVAGWGRTDHFKQYGRTVLLDLNRPRSEILASFSKRVRTRIGESLANPTTRFGQIPAGTYADRIRYLHALPFARTSGASPPLDIAGMEQDSSNRKSSVLVGVFMRDGKAPADLVGIAWARLQGDHAVLEVTALARTEELNHLSLGFGLIWEVIDWAVDRGAKWFDLGGLTTLDPAADDPMRGIVLFKRRFSTDLRDVAEEWHLEPSPALAAAAAAIRFVVRGIPFRNAK